jgi:isopenicillin-N epimerase
MDGRLRPLFLLRDGVIFLNHGSFGACPRPVFDAYQRWQLELERQPVDLLGRRFASEMAEARRTLAAYVGAEADDLVYVTNATTGLNAVAKSLPLKPGDEVLASDQEYGALDRTWRFVCEARGARYVRAPVDIPVQSQADVVDAIWDGVTARTRVLFLSHITSPTGIIFPVAELTAKARESGILSVIDGAHAPGQIPVRLDELGADFYAGNCHKWMMAPKGAGFLHARRDVQALVEPLVVSWGWRSDRPGPSRFIDYHEWQGTRDISAFLSVPIAVRFMEEHDWADVSEASHELLSTVRSRIADELGLPPATVDSRDLYAQMTGFLLSDLDPGALQTRLRDEFSIEIPVIEFDGRSTLRVSVQGYNTKSDLDALVDALGVILRT